MNTARGHHPLRLSARLGVRGMGAVYRAAETKAQPRRSHFR